MKRLLTRFNVWRKQDNNYLLVLALLFAVWGCLMALWCWFFFSLASLL